MQTAVFDLLGITRRRRCASTIALMTGTSMVFRLSTTRAALVPVIRERLEQQQPISHLAAVIAGVCFGGRQRGSIKGCFAQ